MGPGSRRDTLDDHWGDWNWRKCITLGDTMLKHANRAIEMREKHVLAYHGLCQGLSQNNQDLWRGMVAQWEQDPDRAINPYESSVRPMTLASIKLQLLQEDAQMAVKGNQPATMIKCISPTSMIAQGLDLEELQLAYDLNALALCKRIDGWTSLQVGYMPITALLHSESNVQKGCGSNASNKTTKIPLSLPTAVWEAGEECDARLVDIEWRLRHAACSDELEKMRKHLLSRNWVRNFKTSYGHGQRQGGRSATTLESLNNKVDACTARYRKHRDILKAWGSALKKNDAWMKDLRSLKEEDIRELHTAGLEALGEGERQLSWIWHVQRADISDNKHLVDSLRIQWCKSRARALRWQEECLLIQEELCRSY
ncbi:hypothetical protein BDP27DRAFT_1430701 [Rhodocollybia butyracea]|uniref:Uncharacterized protein n=1 Tax=Rhodocollybia butyracea TaxID=206335 RepID=A0A9P5PBW9_9AGAR|nr:hypothetical protein BDP27DRAFT_1430701 [Rhodocollybia butyracea]